MHDVFISYSTKDAAIADAVCHRLESDGIRCWYAPRDEKVGSGWAGQITRAIREARVFLLIYSHDYNQSAPVISELTEAVDAGCTIVPFRVDQTAMNDDLSFYLKKVHWLDAINPPTRQQIETLYTHISRILWTTPPPPPPPPPTPWYRKLLKLMQPYARLLLTVLVMAVVAVYYHLKPEPEPLPDPVPTVSETVAPKALTKRQKINFDSLSNLPNYKYPFWSTSMLSDNGNFFMLENRETGDLVLARTDNGSIYLSGLDLEYSDPQQIRLCMTDGYDTIYFIDSAEKKITSYDREKKQWINKEGVYPELSDTESIILATTYVENMLEDNSRMEEMILLMYDASPEVDCLSKWINVHPDGTMDISDISQYQLVEFVQAVNRVGYSSILMVDKNRSLRILDEKTRQVLDLSHETILQDYLPYIYDSTVISEDKQYYLSTQNDRVQVWNLLSGNRVYSDTFTGYVSAYFSAPHEIIVFDKKAGNVFTYDLETDQETIIMDQDYFKNNSVFMNQIINFYYFDKYDICAFCVSDGYDADTLESEWRIILTNQQGTVLAASDNLKTHNGSHTCNLHLTDNVFLAEMTLADPDTSQREDNVVTELFRAPFFVDEAGNLVFE